jgi:iron complex outermembrane receptor protein
MRPSPFSHRFRNPGAAARFGSLTLALAASTLHLGLAAAAPAQAVEIALAPQPLAQAVEALARQLGLQVTVDPSLLAGRVSPGLKGLLTPQEALHHLLQGTGLEAQLVDRHVTIQRAAEQVLKEVRVKAGATKETATSAVRGYLPRRSVTATKTDIPLAETPQAVSVVSREQMEDQGSASLNDALNYASGVRANAYGVDSRGDWVRVRGSEPSQFLDGLQQIFGYNNNTRPDPYSLERVEVLRGPSSMLYGQGSTGGVVNLQSKRPLAERQAEVGLQLGSFNRRQIQGDATGPLTDDGTWSYRVVALARKSDTQVDFVPDDRLMVAPSLAWRPDADTSLVVQAHIQKDTTGSSATFLPWSGTVLPNPNGQIPTSRFVSEPGFDEYIMRRATLGYLFEHRFANGWTVRQNLRYSASKGSYQSLYPASNFMDPENPYLDPDQRLISRYIWVNKRDGRGLVADQSLEGSVRTAAVEHRILFGLDHSRYSEEAQSGFGFSPSFDLYAPEYGHFTPPELSRNPDVLQRQTGVYLQDHMKLGTRWSLLLGLRHDRLSSELQGAATEHDRATTRRIALMHHFDQGWSPYVSYSESFQPVAGTNFYGQRYKPLRGEQVEAGLKFQSPSGATLVNVAYYDLREKNRQVNDPVQPLNTLQAGETRNRGFEVEAKTRIGKAFELVANFDHTDLDSELEAVPQNQGSLWGKWRFTLAGVTGWNVGAGLRHTSSFRNPGAPTVAATTLVDLMLGLDTGSWRYALNVTNLTDKIHASTILGRGDTWYGPRRNVQASVTFRF